MFLFPPPHCLRQQRRKELFVPLGRKEEALLTHKPEEINQQHTKKRNKQNMNKFSNLTKYMIYVLRLTLYLIIIF
jgi:hypothetical protein